MKNKKANKKKISVVVIIIVSLAILLQLAVIIAVMAILKHNKLNNETVVSDNRETLVKVQDSLQNDVSARLVSERINEDLSNTDDSNGERNTLVEKVLNKADIIILGLDDNHVTVKVVSPDFEKIQQESAVIDISNKTLSEITKLYREFIIERLDAGDFEKVESQVVLPYKNTENGIEVEYTEEFLNALFCGMNLFGGAQNEN